MRRGRCSVRAACRGVERRNKGAFHDAGKIDTIRKDDRRSERMRSPLELGGKIRKCRPTGKAVAVASPQGAPLLQNRLDCGRERLDCGRVRGSEAGIGQQVAPAKLELPWAHDSGKVDRLARR